ncbi:MAG: ribonuclease HII [candidate division Zixibacteria bacterium RBG_16_48_11]|nr:MAG: ribonuclease HII [candidate division Zixibacteria bacterium RBG_16_48_11]
MRFENELWQQGFKSIAGVDEVGRGPLAGPVVAAAVIFEEGVAIEGINDSKRLSPIERLSLSREIELLAKVFSVGMVTPVEIDRYNILKASLMAMRWAILGLAVKPDFVLVDGRERIGQLGIPQRPIIKGDSLSQSIAAASILAKVARDKMMEKLHHEFPHFDFAHNQGYGTKEHKRALKEFGPCPQHRKSFAPVAKAYAKSKESSLKL